MMVVHLIPKSFIRILIIQKCFKLLLMASGQRKMVVYGR